MTNRTHTPTEQFLIDLPASAHMRTVTIETLRRNLKARSGKAWSVKGGTGTSWGWITVSAPPKRLDQYGAMTDADRHELAALLGEAQAHSQGHLIEPGTVARAAAIDASGGLTTHAAPAADLDPFEHRGQHPDVCAVCHSDNVVDFAAARRSAAARKAAATRKANRA